MTTLTILGRILVGGIVGMLVGLGTSRYSVRLFAMVGAASALLTVASTEFFQLLAYPWYSDPGRLSAQIISAVGFFGTGLIWISEKNQVRGLSVAASLWLTAILGILIGAGLDKVSVLAVFLVVVVYWLADKITKWNN